MWKVNFVLHCRDDFFFFSFFLFAVLFSFCKVRHFLRHVCLTFVGLYLCWWHFREQNFYLRKSARRTQRWRQATRMTASPWWTPWRNQAATPTMCDRDPPPGGEKVKPFCTIHTAVIFSRWEMYTFLAVNKLSTTRTPYLYFLQGKRSACWSFDFNCGIFASFSWLKETYFTFVWIGPEPEVWIRDFWSGTGWES